MLVPALLLALAQGAAPTPPAGPPPAAAPAAPRSDAPIAARAGADRVTFAELDRCLLERYATGPRGKELVTYLAQRALIAHLGAEAGLKVSDGDLDQRVRELDAQMQRAGVEGGLAGELAREGIEPAEFRSTLRLAILHERLTRRALGLSENEPVTGDQQQIWIDAQLERLGVRFGTPPFEDGIAAHVGPVHVSAGELAELLRQSLDGKELREAMMQLLLLRRVEARLKGVDPVQYEGLVRAELERRRAEAESDPRYRGASFESLLEAQGTSLARLGLDPAVRIAALSTHWVETNHTEEQLQAFHGEERAFFEEHFGAAVHTRALFLVAAETPNELSPRSFAQAEAELVALSKEATGAEAFSALAARHSEDRETRTRGGELGYLVLASRALPKDLVAEVHRAPKGLLGPKRLSNGVALLWVGERRPAPAWEGMRPHVQRELRRRFLMECLPPLEIETFLDPGGVSTPAAAPAQLR